MSFDANFCDDAGLNSASIASHSKQIINGICIQGITVGLGTVTLAYSYLAFVDELGIETFTGPPLLAGVMMLLTWAVMCEVGLGQTACLTAALNAAWAMIKDIFFAIICFGEGLPIPFNWFFDTLGKVFFSTRTCT